MPTITSANTVPPECCEGCACAYGRCVYTYTMTVAKADGTRSSVSAGTAECIANAALAAIAWGWSKTGEDATYCYYEYKQAGPCCTVEGDPCEAPAFSGPPLPTPAPDCTIGPGCEPTEGPECVKITMSPTYGAQVTTLTGGGDSYTGGTITEGDITLVFDYENCYWLLKLNGVEIEHSEGTSVFSIPSDGYYTDGSFVSECDAPCDCPPGLATAYAVTIPSGSVTDGPNSMSWDSQTVVVTTTGDCAWANEFEFEVLLTCDGSTSATTATVALVLFDCKWQLTLNTGCEGLENPTWEKTVGANPLGDYTGVSPTAGTATVE